jgi:hypothetical protein
MKSALDRLRITLGFVALGAAALSVEPALSQSSPSPAEVSKIAEKAFAYGLPLVMNYTVFYEYFIDKTGAQYKAPPDQLYNTARVYTPQDTTIVTPNSDTPYSFVAMDLRAEPSWSVTPTSRRHAISPSNS